MVGAQTTRVIQMLNLTKSGQALLLNIREFIDIEYGDLSFAYSKATAIANSRTIKKLIDDGVFASDKVDKTSKPTRISVTRKGVEKILSLELYELDLKGEKFLKALKTNEKVVKGLFGEREEIAAIKQETASLLKTDFAARAEHAKTTVGRFENAIQKKLTPLQRDLVRLLDKETSATYKELAAKGFRHGVVKRLIDAGVALLDDGVVVLRLSLIRTEQELVDAVVEIPEHSNAIESFERQIVAAEREDEIELAERQEVIIEEPAMVTSSIGKIIERQAAAEPELARDIIQGALETLFKDPADLQVDVEDIVFILEEIGSAIHNATESMEAIKGNAAAISAAVEANDLLSKAGDLIHKSARSIRMPPAPVVEVVPEVVELPVFVCANCDLTGCCADHYEFFNDTQYRCINKDDCEYRRKYHLTSAEIIVDVGDMYQEKSGEGVIIKSKRMPDYSVTDQGDRWAAFHRFELLDICEEKGEAEVVIIKHAIAAGLVYTPANCDVCVGHYRPEELTSITTLEGVELICERCEDTRAARKLAAVSAEKATVGDSKPAGFSNTFAAIKALSEGVETGAEKLEDAIQDHIKKALKALAAAQVLMVGGDKRRDAINRITDKINDQLFPI